jgi:hypothetical protein
MMMRKSSRIRVNSQYPCPSRGFRVTRALNSPRCGYRSTRSTWGQPSTLAKASAREPPGPARIARHSPSDSDSIKVGYHNRQMVAKLTRANRG